MARSGFTRYRIGIAIRGNGDRGGGGRLPNPRLAEELLG
jgi:hypothetical protein